MLDYVDGNGGIGTNALKRAQLAFWNSWFFPIWSISFVFVDLDSVYSV